MIISVLVKTERCLPFILHEGGIVLKDCQIRDYKSFRDGKKALILIGYDVTRLKTVARSASMRAYYNSYFSRL